MDYKNLKDAIKAVIKKNGAQEITGQIMQDTLLSIVSKLGGNKTFAGVATPTTVPDTTDANIFYIAGENGTYVNFSGAKIENEAAVFVQASGGTWRTIYTGIQTAYGVDKRLQEEHEQFDTALDRIQTDLTQFKQTEFADVKEDVAGHSTEIAKNKSDITKINGEIATLNEATNTAADELVRIEGKVDANLKDAVVVFVPSTNTGVYKGADILSFTNDTPTSTVTAYMSQYWDKLVKLASGKISGSVYAESNNANCTGGSCIGGTQFGYLKIEIEDYKKPQIGAETLTISFNVGENYNEMTFSKSESAISIVVYSCNSIAQINNDIYGRVNVHIYEKVYWYGRPQSVSLKRDTHYESAEIYVSGVEQIEISARVADAANVLLVDITGKQIGDYSDMFRGGYNTRIIDLKKHPTAHKILISNHFNYGAKETHIRARIVKYKGDFFNEINEALGRVLGLDVIISESSAGFNPDGSINNVLSGYNREVYAINSIKSLLITSEVEENHVSIVALETPESQSGTVIEVGPVSGARIFETNKVKTNYICIMHKTDSAYQVKVNNPKGGIYTLLSDLYKKSSVLSIYGDSVSKSFGEEISPNDDYAPSNEVQTLENKPRYKSYAYYLAKRNKLKWYDFAFEKATLTDCKTKAAPDLNCVLADDAIISMTDQKPDYITLWYGVNDAQFNPIMQRELWLKDKYKANIAYPMQESEIGKDGYATAEQKAEVDKAVGRVGEVDYDNADAYFFAKFVGTENDEELTTWCGALNYALPLLMAEYPTAKILLIVPDHETHGEMLRKETIKMAEKWGILYFDLNSLPYWYGSEKTKFENTQNEEMSWLLASGETAAPTVEGFNKSRYSYDGIIPSDLGHKVISFPIGNKLING